MKGDTLARDAIRQAHREDEQACVTRLAGGVAAMRGDPARVDALARRLVAAVRTEREQAAGIDQLMHEFSLSSQEGVALMCLAEALLRIPDRATADRLIRDKLAKGDWRAHLGHSASLFVNAAAWGLYVTGRLIATHSENHLGSTLTRLLQRGGEPIVRRAVDVAMRLLGNQFVMGQTIGEAIERSRGGEERGYRHSFDMLGEAAATTADALRYFEAYKQAIDAVGSAAAGRGPRDGPGISVKLSALHPRYVRSQRARVLGELLPRLRELACLARSYNLGLNIDAEESERLELSLDLIELLADDGDLVGWEGLGFVVQAYQKRALPVVEWLLNLARRRRCRLMVRLVKGAYWDGEIKRAQVEGQSGYPVFTRKCHTDISYLACAARLLENADAIYAQFATHNAHTVAAICQMAAERAVGEFEFQCLHGMGESLYDHFAETSGLDVPCRIYAPVGTHETLLPYLVRRLLENGANASFVHRLVDPGVSVDDLVEDPLDRASREGAGAHPALPLPLAIYGPSRRNSAGADLADEATLAEWQRGLSENAAISWWAGPRVAGRAPQNTAAQPAVSPADREVVIGHWCQASPQTVDAAIAAAQDFLAQWRATLPAQRADLLLRAADGLEVDRSTLASLCIREAGKTWGNALGEVREAVDYCRYYAARLLAGDIDQAADSAGVTACISPWNFPLAIFVGQVSAALAAGCPVLAKAAEQTPLVAARAVEIFSRAGVPPAALQFLPGDGETVGARLVGDPRVRCVLFTGSTAVARGIAQRLAERPGARLIAETGGVNAMIVDSSALPEQVVQDVLVSAFDSAGQRCSALRLLCVQEEIAERILPMLRLAMDELVVGDPQSYATDVGPVIDESAKTALQRYIDSMRAQGRAVFQGGIRADGEAGTFVPPTLIEIAEPADLPGEVFGPVLHVLRYPADGLDSLIAAINGFGYGLTMGIHSRIDETVQTIVAHARVGNLYVNRTMVGAVVGVQPFGGEGLSGTGPKAGGPLLLHRLAGSALVAPSSLGARAGKPVEGPLDILSAWAQATGRTELAEYATRCRSASLLGCEIDLGGPTGEDNRMRFMPRGIMWCGGADERAHLAQLAAILATGNSALWEASPESRRAFDLLPQLVRDHVLLGGAGQRPLIRGILAEAGDRKAWEVQRALAAGEGPLVTVFVAGRDGLYPLHEMLVERVVTVNLAAAGGNAALMSLNG